MNEIRGILFDKDGTLLDFDATWGAFAQELVMEAAGGDPQEAARLLRLIGYDPQTRRFAAGSLFAAGTNAELVAALHPDLSGERLAHRIAEANRRATAIPVLPLPGVAETIRLLGATGFRLGLATNVARPKPAPDVVLAFAGTVGLNPAHIAVVGDNPHDMRCARDAGAGLAIGVLSGNSRREDLAPLADCILESVADLPALFGVDAAADENGFIRP
jgi:phosphoglycolate phosphatase